MAEVIKYGMGQLRYVNTSPSSYMTNQNFKYSPIKTAIASVDDVNDSTDTEFYQDVYLSSNDLNFNFVAGTPYLLRLDIPKDVSYDCIYQIKMVTPLSNVVDNAKMTYQMLKYITIPQAVGNGNTSRVILYPVTTKDKYIKTQDTTFDTSKTYYELDINNEYIETTDTAFNSGKIYYEKIIAGTSGVDDEGTYNVKIAIAKTLNDNPSKDDIVFEEPTDKESTGKYYVYDGEDIKTSQEILNKNDTILEHVWATSSVETPTVHLDVIFTPRSTDATYTGIFIQMQRSSLDYDIYSSTDNVYGRMLDIDHPKWKAEVYELTNLLGQNSVPKEITNIGVYSHPNLLMAINGEEIRVGQSGYYELNDFNINSLAIAASDNKDNFTVDYQYKTTS